MKEWITVFFLITGSLFALVAAIGVLRLPDVLARMHAATKAGAFGTSLLLVASAVHFGSASAVAKAVLVVLFFYVTAPVGGHLLGRAAYRRLRDRLRLLADEWR